MTKKNEQRLRAVGYIRVSDESQVDGYSLDAQRADLREILDQMVAGAIDASHLIDGVVDAEKLANAYEALSKCRSGSGTLILRW